MQVNNIWMSYFIYSLIFFKEKFDLDLIYFMYLDISVKVLETDVN